MCVFLTHGVFYVKIAVCHIANKDDDDDDIWQNSNVQCTTVHSYQP